MKSMTGYGISRGVFKDEEFSVEIRSVNGRYFEFSSTLPYFLYEYELEIKALLKDVIRRGRVKLAIRFSGGKTDFFKTKDIDFALASRYVKELKELAGKTGVKSDIAISDILALPGIVREESIVLKRGEFKKIFLPVIRDALLKFDVVREKEGKNIKKDFLLRIKKIRNFISGIDKKAKSEPSRIRKKIKDKIKNSKIKNMESVSDTRLEQEILYYIDRIDITEEIVRLKSHCGLFADILNSERDIGKRLEFLLQEMVREANTIASKSQNNEIVKRAIDIKLENEKIREQVQNIE